MLTLINSLLLGMALAGLLLVMVFSIEICAAVLLPRRVAQPFEGGVPPFCVLIPAHNEAAGIVSTLQSVRARIRPIDTILVVADNCTDQTAELCRQQGIEVIERIDAERRGKGFALDHGVRHLMTRPPSAIVIMDADVVVAQGNLVQLVSAAIRSGRPAQASYQMLYDGAASLSLRFSALAWRFKNCIRPLGLANLGLPCQLMGSGMAFPWSLVEHLNWGTASIVEDMLLGLDSAKAGHAPLFVPEVEVLSQFPTDSVAQETQRRRWQHGHLQLIFGVAIRLLFESLRRRSWAMLAMTCDLLIPPLTLLAVVLLGLVLLGAVLSLLTGDRLQFLLVCGVLFLFCASFLLGWRRMGGRILRGRELLMLPFFVVQRLPSLFAYIWRPERRWIRTTRRGD